MLPQTPPQSLLRSLPHSLRQSLLETLPQSPPQRLLVSLLHSLRQSLLQSLLENLLPTLPQTVSRSLMLPARTVKTVSTTDCSHSECHAPMP